MEKGSTSSSRLAAVVLKALGVFGSAEGLAMLCGVVRIKLVALWVGAAGVGLFGLFNSVVEMLGAYTQTGIRNSAVRQIASRPDGVMKRVSIFVARRLGVVFGVIAGLICAVLSVPLSNWSFGNSDYWWAFCCLGFSIALNSVTAIESGVLQGVHRLSDIARASVSGSFMALCVSVPILYLWRINGVVPVILAYSVCIFACYWWRRYKQKFNHKEVDRERFVESSNEMMRFGGYLAASTFVMWCVNYILMSYINNEGGETELGYYQCGYTLIIRYLGVAFSAIGMEFFPRLSKAMANGTKRGGVLVSHEIYVMLCVVVSLGCVLAAFAPWAVRLLYSEEFMPAVPYVVVAMLGCVWRCAGWCMGYMIVAKGDGGVYMILEVGSGIMCLLLSWIGYAWLGIVGLGWAFALWYVVYAAAVYSVVRARYGFRMSRATMWWMVWCVVLSGLAVGLSMSVEIWWAGVFALFVCGVCVWMLRRG